MKLSVMIRRDTTALLSCEADWNNSQKQEVRL